MDEHYAHPNKCHIPEALRLRFISTCRNTANLIAIHNTNLTPSWHNFGQSGLYIFTRLVQYCGEIARYPGSRWRIGDITRFIGWSQNLCWVYGEINELSRRRARHAYNQYKCVLQVTRLICPACGLKVHSPDHIEHQAARDTLIWGHSCWGWPMGTAWIANQLADIHKTVPSRMSMLTRRTRRTECRLGHGLGHGW